MLFSGAKSVYPTGGLGHLNKWGIVWTLRVLYIPDETLCWHIKSMAPLVELTNYKNCKCTGNYAFQIGKQRGKLSWDMMAVLVAFAFVLIHSTIYNQYDCFISIILGKTTPWLININFPFIYPLSIHTHPVQGGGGDGAYPSVQLARCMVHTRWVNCPLQSSILIGLIWNQSSEVTSPLSESTLQPFSEMYHSIRRFWIFQFQFRGIENARRQQNTIKHSECQPPPRLHICL